MVQTATGQEPAVEDIPVTIIPATIQQSEELPQYQASEISQQYQYYDLKDLYKFENSKEIILLNDQLSNDLFYLQQTYYFKWLSIAHEMEKHIKAIIYDRAVVQPDLVTFINKRIIPYMEQMLNKLILSQEHLKLQTYCSELMLLIQRLSMHIWKQHPSLALSLLKRIFNPMDPKLFDSRFDDRNFIPVINNFYGERLMHQIPSEHTGYPRAQSTSLYNSMVFYPLQGEVLESNRLHQIAYYLSPFLRIQIHYFYTKGGLDMLTEGVLNWSLQNIDILELLAFFESYLEKQFYMKQFEIIRPALLSLSERISEEELRTSTKEHFARLSNAVEKVLNPFYTAAEVREYVGLMEMNIYMQCFRCSNLEKRIFGVQQFCDKINICLDNEFIGRGNQMIKDEWYIPKNLVEFFRKHKVFDEIFGEKAHFELIKRSFPILRFLYKHGEIHKKQVIQLVRMIRGKHETWSNIMYRILNDLAEILVENDMEVILNEIRDMKADQNLLNFVRSMGRNHLFEKKENKILKKQKVQNENVLEELDIEQQREENISNLKQDNLVIKVHGDEQCEKTMVFTQNQNARKAGTRKYVQQFNQQVQQEESDDTCCEEGEGIRGRIIDYLLELVHQEPESEVGKQAFNIVYWLICNQFKSLRHKYLVYSFQRLFDNAAALPPNLYMTLIQKIIQSTYPLDRFDNQTELIKWLETTYNFKISILAMLGRVKKTQLESNGVVAAYLEQAEAILKFYQYLFQASEAKIDGGQLRILWQLIVENAINQQEQDIFFVWLCNVNKSLLTPDCQQLLFFEYLIKVDYNSYTIHMLNCLTGLILYYNLHYRMIKSDHDSYILQNHELIGIEIVWRLLFECDNPEISNKALQFLMSITKFRPVNQTVMNQLKEYYIHKVFEYMKKNQIFKSLELCIRILEELEGLKTMKNEKGEKITATIDNKCKGALPPKRQEVQLYSSMTVLQAKQLIGSKINPPMRGEDIEIVCRGAWLKDNKNVKDYKFYNKNTFILTSKATTDEETASRLYPPDGPKVAGDQPIVMGSGYVQLIQSKQPNQYEMDNKVQKTMEFTGEADKGFVQYLLDQKNWNEESVIGDLFEIRDTLYLNYQDACSKDPQLDSMYQQQSQAQPQQLIQPQQQQQQAKVDGYVCVATLISENSEYFTLLFDILNINNPQYNVKIWHILQMIPRNKEIYELIDKCVNDSQWDRFIDLSNPHRLFYNLQILRETLECDMIEDQEEFKKRKECREKFLTQGALNQIIQLIYNENMDTNLVGVALSIYSIYSNAYALSIIQSQEEFNRLMNIKESVNGFYKQFEDKMSTSYFLGSVQKQVQQVQQSQQQQQNGLTPTFQSTNPTPPPEENISVTLIYNQVNTFDEFKLLIQSFRDNTDLQQSIQIQQEQLIIRLVKLIPLNMEQVFSILLTTLYLNPELIQYVYQIPHISQQFAELLTKSQSEELRRMVACTIMTMSELSSQQNTSSIIKELDFQLLSQYLNILNTVQTEYEDLFVVLSNLIQKVDNVKLGQIVDCKLLFNQIATFLIDRPIIEERFAENEDKLIQGHLLLLTSLIEVEPRLKLEMVPNLTKEIYDFLFHLSDDYNSFPKLKRKVSRKRAFKLLIESCRNCEANFVQLLDPIMRNHEKLDPSELDNDTGVKGTHGFVGLKNLGATCYINSLLQQLFMNTTIRKGILNGEIMIKTPQIDNIENHQIQDGVYLFKNIECLDNAEIKKFLVDHTLYQLQQVFIQLQESVRQYINPQLFIQSIQGYDNQPINVLVQSDVNEFFNLLTDKLERNQQHTKFAQLIQDAMGGILGHELKSQDPDYEFSNETDEPFLTVTIEIKGKKSLEEALNMFIKGDILEGENKYYCEQANKKLDAVKRCYFKKLPKMFVITLKRFEFDYNTMLKQKVNDFFEFPPEINMFKWTKDHLIDELCIDDQSDYMYRLNGVLVHTGSAESGHYYSFIRQGDKWFEFNDKLVQPFKFENLKEECFGGHHENNTVYEWDTTKSKNAYLLFYEKVKMEHIQIDDQVELQMKQRIQSENSLFLKNQLFYSVDYLCFVKDFICQYNFPNILEVDPIISYNHQMLEDQIIPDSLIQVTQLPAMKVIKLITLFSYETLIKNKDVQGFVDSMQTIITLYDKVLPASFWLLDHLTNNKQMLIDILFESSYIEVKQHFVKLLISCITTVFKVEEDYLSEEVWVGNLPYIRSNLSRFLLLYIEDLLPVLKKNLRRGSEYLQVIKYVVGHSPKLLQRLQETKTIKALYTVFTSTMHDNLSGNVMSLIKLNEKQLEGPCVALIEIIGRAILGSRTNGMQIALEDSPMYLFKGQQKYVQLDTFFNEQLFNKDEFKKYMITLGQLSPSLIDICKHLAWNDRHTSGQIISQLLNVVLDYFTTWQQIDPIFHLIQGVLKIKDIYQNDRIQMFFTRQKYITYSPKGNSIIEAINQMYDNDKNYVFNIMVWIGELGVNCKAFEAYLISNPLDIKSTLYKMRNYKMYILQIQLPIAKINKCINQLELIFGEKEYIKEKEQFIQFEDAGDLNQNNNEQFQNTQEIENENKAEICINDLIQANNERYQSDEQNDGSNDSMNINLSQNFSKTPPLEE